MSRTIKIDKLHWLYQSAIYGLEEEPAMSNGLKRSCEWKWERSNEKDQRMSRTIKINLLNALLMLPMNGPSLENKNEVLKILEKSVTNYQSLDHWENKVGGKYNTNKKNRCCNSDSNWFKYGGKQSVSGKNKCQCCSSQVLCYGCVRSCATHNSFASYNGNVIRACHANKVDHQ